MTYEELKQRKELILLDCISGSTAYNLNIAGSDVDKKGIFIMRQEQLYGFERQDQIANASNDGVYFEIGRFLDLLAKNIPYIGVIKHAQRACIISPYINGSEQAEGFLVETLPGYLCRICANTDQEGPRLKKKIDKPLYAECKSVLDFCFMIHDNGSIPLKGVAERIWFQPGRMWLSELGSFQKCLLAVPSKAVDRGAV